MSRLGRLRWGLLLAFVVIATSRTRAWQLPPIPYDAEAVRRQAENIFKENADIARGLPGDHDEGAKLEFIVKSLNSLKDLSGVEPRVLDALVTQAGTGRMAVGAIVRFGDRAVVPLIASARTTSPSAAWARAGALRCLTELVGQESLTTTSKTNVLVLARDMLAAPRVSFFELSSAAVLAIATGDPSLRAAATRLIDPDELHARGIDDLPQRMVIRSITEALARFPAR